jgi:hypothetical protein
VNLGLSIALVRAQSRGILQVDNHPRKPNMCESVEVREGVKRTDIHIDTEGIVMKRGDQIVPHQHCIGRNAYS